MFVSSYNLKDERKKFVIPFSYKFIFYQFQFMARQDIIVVLFTSTLDLFRNAKYVGAAISQMSIFLVLGTKNDSFVENWDSMVANFTSQMMLDEFFACSLKTSYTCSNFYRISSCNLEKSDIYIPTGMLLRSYALHQNTWDSL